MVYPLLLVPGPVNLSLNVRDALRLPVIHPCQSEYGALLEQTHAALLGLYDLPTSEWITRLMAGLPQSMNIVMAAECLVTPEWGIVAPGHSNNVLEQLNLTEFIPVLTIADTAQFDELLIQWLDQHESIKHLWVSAVHPLTGDQLPLDRLAEVCVERGIRWLLDASFVFGAGPINNEWPLDIIIARTDTCLHAPAGSVLVLQKRTNDWHPSQQLSASSCFYPHAEGAQQHLFPSQLLQGLLSALKELAEAGGSVARRRQYARNQSNLQRLLKRYGVLTLSNSDSFPGIQLYQLPELISQQRFAEELLRQGFVVNPASAPSDNQVVISVMGDMDELPLSRLHQALEDILHPISVNISH